MIEEIKAANMPSVVTPVAHTPPPQMDADDLMPLHDDIIIGASSDEQSQISKNKLVNSLSFSYASGALDSALSKVKVEEDLLANSCYSSIRLDKGTDDFDDDELTNLDWLYDNNLLKNIGGYTRLCPSPLSSDDDFSDLDYESGKENDSLNSSFASTASPQPHPSHIPYNPLKHVNSKPPYSFSCLIFMAIEEAPDLKLPVKDIYSWILTHFPYFQNAPTGWKNSVRHNLSLNKCFQKVDKDKTSNIGKGSYWCIDQNYRPSLLQALRKTPYHPFHQLQMMSVSPLTMTPQRSSPLANRFGSANKSFSPQLFPYLSKRLNNTQIDSLDTDIDVAKALVSLKKSQGSVKHNSRMRSLNIREGSRSRSPSPPEFGSTEDKARTTRRSRRATSPIIVTEVPTLDHTYSASTVPKVLMGSPGSSSIDGEYEFNEKTDDDDELMSGDEFDPEEEEEMSMEVDKTKEMEGVNALLNLASIATSMSDIDSEPKSSPPPPPTPPVSTRSSTRSFTRSRTFAKGPVKGPVTRAMTGSSKRKKNWP